MHIVAKAIWKKINKELKIRRKGMKRTLKHLTSLFLTLAMIFPSVTVFAEDTQLQGTKAQQQESRPAEELKLPTELNDKYYTEIPVYYNGNKVNEVTLHLNKTYTNGGKQYELNGDVSVKLKGYAYKDGSNVKLGLVYGFYGYNNWPGDPVNSNEKDDIVWIQNFYEQVGNHQVSLNTNNIDEWKNSVNKNNYTINFEEIKFRDSSTQGRDVFCVATAKSNNAVFNGSDDQGATQVAFVTFGKSTNALTIDLKVISEAQTKDTYQAKFKDDVNNMERILKDGELIVAKNSYVNVGVEGRDLVVQRYKVIKDTNKPILPLNIENWNDLGKLNASQENSQENYPDMMLDKQGYLSTRHYDYSGDHSTREITFGNPIGDNLVIQKAVGTGNKKYSGASDAYAFFEDSNIITQGGANKAVKFWGYLKPTDINAGEFNLGSNSDDGAYGYVMIGNEREVFVEDWKIEAAYNRSNNTNVKLEPNKVYPIYMEWYEGQPTNKAFLPSYKEAGSKKWKTIPSDWFYPSSNTEPGDINTAYFTPKTISDIPLGSTPGTYYVVVSVKDKAGKESQLSYGPIKIEDNKPITVDDEDKNMIVPASISNIYWKTTFENEYKDVSYTLDVSGLVNEEFDVNVANVAIDGSVENKLSNLGTDKVGIVIKPVYNKNILGAISNLVDKEINGSSEKQLINLDLSKVSVAIKPESSKYKITSDADNKIHITFDDGIVISGEQAITIYIPTDMGSSVNYANYKTNYVGKVREIEIKVCGKKKYYVQTVTEDGTIVQEEKYEENPDGTSPEILSDKIELKFSEIPRVQ